MATKARPAPPLRPTINGLVPNDQAPGREVTIGTFIVEQIRAGVDPLNASGVVGVTPAEFSAWMREGAVVFARLNAGSDWDRDFTPEQQDCAVFADQVIRGHSSHISRLSVISEQAARGTLAPRVVTTKKTKTVAGAVTEVEESTRTEAIAPDMDMVKWKLERLEPTIYGTKATLNLTVSDMTDTDAVADVVEQRMREVAASLLPKAIEATATEEPQHKEPTK